MANLLLNEYGTYRPILKLTKIGLQVCCKKEQGSNLNIFSQVQTLHSRTQLGVQITYLGCNLNHEIPVPSKKILYNTMDITMSPEKAFIMQADEAFFCKMRQKVEHIHSRIGCKVCTPGLSLECKQQVLECNLHFHTRIFRPLKEYFTIGLPVFRIKRIVFCIP